MVRLAACRASCLVAPILVSPSPAPSTAVGSDAGVTIAEAVLVIDIFPEQVSENV